RRGTHRRSRQDDPDTVVACPLRPHGAARGCRNDRTGASGARSGLSGAPEREGCHRYHLGRHSPCRRPYVDRSGGKPCPSRLGTSIRSDRRQGSASPTCVYPTNRVGWSTCTSSELVGRLWSCSIAVQTGDRSARRSSSSCNESRRTWPPMV